MADFIFSPATGLVAKVQVPHGDIAVPARISFDVDRNNSFTSRVDAIIIASDVQMSVSHQLMDTLGGDLFLTVFNHSPMGINVRALVFESMCSNQAVAQDKGASAMLDDWWFSKNAFATEEPVKIAFGNTKTIDAYLVNLRASMQGGSLGTVAVEGVWQVTFTLIGVPPRFQSGGVRLAQNDSSSDSSTSATTTSSAAQGFRGQPLPVSNSNTVVAAQSASINASGDPLTPTSAQITETGYMPVGRAVTGILNTVRAT